MFESVRWLDRCCVMFMPKGVLFGCRFFVFFDIGSQLYIPIVLSSAGGIYRGEESIILIIAKYFFNFCLPNFLR